MSVLKRKEDLHNSVNLKLFLTEKFTVKKSKWQKKRGGQVDNIASDSDHDPFSSVNQGQAALCTKQAFKPL